MVGGGGGGGVGLDPFLEVELLLLTQPSHELQAQYIQEGGRARKGGTPGRGGGWGGGGRPFLQGGNSLQRHWQHVAVLDEAEDGKNISQLTAHSSRRHILTVQHELKTQKHDYNNNLISKADAWFRKTMTTWLCSVAGGCINRLDAIYVPVSK